MSLLAGIPTRGFAVTASDTASNTAAALYIGGAGDVAVETEAGDEITFASVPAGTVLPIRVVKVLSTGTTATDILGLNA